MTTAMPCSRSLHSVLTTNEAKNERAIHYTANSFWDSVPLWPTPMHSQNVEATTTAENIDNSGELTKIDIQHESEKSQQSSRVW